MLQAISHMQGQNKTSEGINKERYGLIMEISRYEKDKIEEE